MDSNIENMTIKQVLQSFRKLHIAKIISLAGTAIAILTAVFYLGQYSYQKSEVLALDTPFAMRIDIVQDHDHHDFQKIEIIKDSALPQEDKDHASFTIRQLEKDHEFDVKKIGVIIVRKQSSKLWQAIEAIF